MPHPFQDKLFHFIGKPKHGTRQTVRDALISVGGVVDDSLTLLTEFVLAMDGAEKTKVYKRALQYEKYGQLSILSESQFLDILNGNAPLPEKPDNKHSDHLVIIPADSQTAADAEMEGLRKERIEIKRVRNLAKHGLPTPDGRIKVDMLDLYTANMIVRFLKDKFDAVSDELKCDFCVKQASIYVTTETGGEIKLCVECNNKKVAELIGTEVPVDFPEHVTVNDKSGNQHLFMVQLLMLPAGMSLIAREKGNSRYKAEVFGKHGCDFDGLWKLLIRQIEKSLSVKYMDNQGLVVGNKAVGYIEYNFLRGTHDIIIDGKPYTWQELEQNLPVHEGFKITIEFDDFSEMLD